MQGFRFFSGRQQHLRLSASLVKERNQVFPSVVGGFVEVVQDDEPPFRSAFQKPNGVVPAHSWRLFRVTDDSSVGVAMLLHLGSEGEEKLLNGQREFRPTGFPALLLALFGEASSKVSFALPSKPDKNAHRLVFIFQPLFQLLQLPFTVKEISGLDGFGEIGGSGNDGSLFSWGFFSQGFDSPR